MKIKTPGLVLGFCCVLLFWLPGLIRNRYALTPIEYNVENQDYWKNTNRSLTVVTAFFDLGTIPKGSFSNMRTTDYYKVWMEVYKYLKNPLVIYTDSDKFAEHVTNLRRNSTITTKVIIFTREQLWPFQIKSQIEKLYSNPGYPKHYPNTYLPEYACMTHSKLPLVVKAIKSNYFHTDYYCWIDLGYFRDIVGRNIAFFLEIPEDFDKTKVGVTRVYDSNLKDISAMSIILENKNWIGGGLFLGKPEVLTTFEEQYKNRVLYYLSQGLMNVEQHILYSMYTFEERTKKPIHVEVQLYIPGQHKVMCENPWFYLGFLMYHEVQNSTVGNGKSVIY